MKELKIKSPAFEHNGLIPRKYTCDGEDVNPSLVIEDIPGGAQSLALIVDDPDASMGTWNHWVVWNIPPMKEIKENTVPGIEGMNDFRKHSYGGPCPPGGTHRYFFKVYALDTKLNLGANSRKKDLEKAMQGHILAMGELMGRYSRK
jgi:Raf kinase inhibitor-like YbhB/YbcL family protein